MFRRLAAPTLAVVVATGCRPADPDLVSLLGPPRPIREADRALAAGANAFGWRLLERLAAGDAPNAVVSPASVALALALAHGGASPPVADEIRRVLGAGSATDSSEAYGNLIRALLSSDPATTLRIANSLWHRREITLGQPYVAEVATRFGARIAALDFALPSAAREINRWVSDQTGGKIPAIIPDAIPVDTGVYLVNALYFKGLWATPFVAKLTKPGEFATLAGRKVPCRFMERFATMEYAETDAYQAVELAYGKGAFRATIVLPRESASADAAIRGLAAGGWDALRAAVREREGTLYLPRFTARFEASLVEPLRALGLKRAFDDADAFPGIASSLQIGEVRHATFVEVNEEGTEATAATSVGMAVTAYRPPDPPFTMRVDRPFLFAIHEVSTGAVLFAGRIGDVAEKGVRG